MPCSRAGLGRAGQLHGSHIPPLRLLLLPPPSCCTAGAAPCSCTGTYCCGFPGGGRSEQAAAGQEPAQVREDHARRTALPLPVLRSATPRRTLAAAPGLQPAAHARPCRRLAAPQTSMPPCFLTMPTLLPSAARVSRLSGSWLTTTTSTARARVSDAAGGTARAAAAAAARGCARAVAAAAAVAAAGGGAPAGAAPKLLMLLLLRRTKGLRLRRHGSHQEGGSGRQIHLGRGERLFAREQQGIEGGTWTGLSPKQPRRPQAV